MAALLSRPARGGWIEIGNIIQTTVKGTSRPARGGWIEISFYCAALQSCPGPAPHGAGGLK